MIIEVISLGMMLIGVGIASFRRDKIALPLAILTWGYLFMIM